jgi:hypothetical protein
MKPFLAQKRRLLELFALVGMDVVLYFVWNSWPLVCLFSFGFIWNWTAAQDLTSLLSNPRYRFSMVRFVGNVHSIILRPIQSWPRWTHFVAKILPAGIFWWMVVTINDSDMPWLGTFIGSLSFELVQFEITAFRKKEIS